MARLIRLEYDVNAGFVGSGEYVFDSDFVECSSGCVVFVDSILSEDIMEKLMVLEVLVMIVRFFSVCKRWEENRGRSNQGTS